jgi:hypothetical protein
MWKSAPRFTERFGADPPSRRTLRIIWRVIRQPLAQSCRRYFRIAAFAMLQPCTPYAAESVTHAELSRSHP